MVHLQEVDGLEHNLLPYRRALPLMWVLAVWAFAKTVVTIICWTIPTTFATTRSFKATLRAVTVRYANGPPRSASFWFDGQSKTLAAIRAGATSYRALDIIYNHLNLDVEGTFGARLGRWWVDMANAQAVRNRLRITESLLSQQIWSRVAKKRVRILSIASGSAQAVVAAVAKCRQAIQAEGGDLEVRLLDRDPAALAYAKQLAEHHGVGQYFTYFQGDAGDFRTVACDRGTWQPDIVEMVGFLDYRPRDKAISLVGKVRQVVAPDGVFLTCHIAANPEAFVLRWLIKWPMLYRSPEAIEEIVRLGGFGRTEVLQEPHEIHTIVVGLT